APVCPRLLLGNAVAVSITLHQGLPVEPVSAGSQGASGVMRPAGDLLGRVYHPRHLIIEVVEHGGMPGGQCWLATGEKLHQWQAQALPGRGVYIEVSDPDQFVILLVLEEPVQCQNATFERRKP